MVGEDLCFWPAPKKIVVNVSEELFFGLHQILGEKSD